MSFNESNSSLNNQLLGQKQKAQSEISEVLLNEATERKDLKVKCHHCGRESQSVQNCVTCGTPFCFQCITEINENKDSSKKGYAKKDDMVHWICFICLKECPCRRCGFDKKERFTSQLDNKCLICKSNISLIKIDDMLAKIKPSEEKRKELIERKNEVSLILQANPNEDKLICMECLKNTSISSFLKGEADPELSDKANASIDKKDIKSETITKQLMIDLQSKEAAINQQPNTISISNKPPSLNDNQLSQGNPQSIGAYDIMSAMNQNSNPFFGMMQQLPQGPPSVPMQIPINMYQGNQGLPNIGVPALSMIQNSLNQQKQTSSSLRSSFASITNLMQNYNNQSLQNNINVLYNINLLSNILTMIGDKKAGTNPNDPNAVEKENSTLKSVWTIIQNLKTQISITNDFTQKQKGLIVQVMKTLEQSMQQEANQNMLNDPGYPLMLMNSQGNPLMFRQPLQQGNEAVLEGLMGKTGYNQGMPLGLNQSPAGSNDKSGVNKQDKASSLANEKEESKVPGMNSQESQGIQGVDLFESMQGNLASLNSNINPIYQMLSNNFYPSPQNMSGIPGNINMLNNSYLPSNPMTQQSGFNGTFPPFMCGPSNLPSALNQIPSMPQGMPLPTQSMPKEPMQMNQKGNFDLLNANASQRMTQGLNQSQGFPSTAQTLYQMPPEFNQSLPQMAPSMNMGLPLSPFPHMQGMPHELPQNMYFYMNPQLGEQYQGLLQNRSFAKEALNGNVQSSPQEDQSTKKKEM